MKSKKIKTIIWGASDHAVVVADALEKQEAYELLGFIDDINPEKKGKVLCGKKIFGGREQLFSFQKRKIKHIALGFGNCSARIESGNFLVDHGFVPLTLIHSAHHICSNVKIGQGTVILVGAIIGPGCNIGNYCIVNNNSTICHNTVIEDGVHICPGVHVAGRVRICSGSWIGIGSCISDKIKIGAKSFIGAGSVVVKDIPDGVLAYGNPARVIRLFEHPF